MLREIGLCVSEKEKRREGHVRESWALNHPILFNEPDFSTKIPFKIFRKVILEKLFEKPFKNPPSKCSLKCPLKLSVSIYGDIWVYEIYGYDDIRKNVLSPQNERLVKKTLQVFFKMPSLNFR